MFQYTTSLRVQYLWLFVLLTLLVSCAPASKPQATTITFAAWEYERSAYAPLIASFNAANPDVQVQFVGRDVSGSDSAPGVGDTLQALAVSADTASVTTVSPTALAQGAFLDIAPLLDADASFDRTDFYPLAALLPENQQVWLIPHSLNIPLLAYNQERWGSHNLPVPTSTWRWADLHRDVTALAQRESNRAPNYGLFDDTGTLALAGELTISPISLPDSTTQSDWLRPEVVALLERVATWNKDGSFVTPITSTNSQAGLSIADAQQAIRDGRVGLWPVGMLDPNTSLTFPVGRAPLPIELRVPFTTINGFVISRGSANPQAAWRWLAYLSRQSLITTDVTTVAARSSLVPGNFWASLDPATAEAVRATLNTPNNQKTVDHRLLAVLQAALHQMQTQGVSAPDALRAASQTPAVQAWSFQPAATPLVVATPRPSAAPGAVTIVFRNILGDTDLVARLVRDFNAAHTDIQVVLADDSLAPPETLITTNLAAHATNVDCFTSGGIPDTTTITRTLDLQPFIDADPTFQLDDYPAVLLQPYRQGSSLYGLPLVVLLRYIGYNTTLFDAVQQPYPTADWTIDTFVQAAERVTSGSGDQRHYGFAGTSPQDLRFFLERANTSPFRGKGSTSEPAFNAPALLGALQRYSTMISALSLQQRLTGYRASNYPEARLQWTLLDQGRVGMYVETGAGRMYASSMRLAPPLLGNGSLAPGDIAPLAGVFVSSESAHPEACWAWINYLIDATGGTFIEGFPARISQATAPTFLARAAPGTAEVYAAYRAAFERTSPELFAQLPPYYDYAPFNLFWFYRAVDRALQGGTLERELSDAQSLTEQYLACVRGGESESTCAKQVDPSYDGR